MGRREVRGEQLVSRRRSIVVAALVALAALSVAVAPTGSAQVLPAPPPLPAPPADGNPLADLLGPASATVCDAVAVVYGLVGPIASAQLPPNLQELLSDTDPYVALLTYACGLLAVPPSLTVCSLDAQVNGPLGLLGLPVALPAATAILYDTAAGLEHALLRLGVDIGTDASRQLAEALGCGKPAPPEIAPPAALPLPDATPTVDLPGGGFGSVAPAGIPAVVQQPASGDTTTQVAGTLGRLGSIRYPVRGAAALLLALPLVVLAAGIALAPHVGPRRRRRLRGAAS
jgi:hypothetical protein